MNPHTRRFRRARRRHQKRVEFVYGAWPSGQARPRFCALKYSSGGAVSVLWGNDVITAWELEKVGRRAKRNRARRSVANYLIRQADAPLARRGSAAS